jgi:mRNA interferase MazF
LQIPNNPTRGEVWRVSLNPTQGDEMGKTRPCVVLSGTSAGRLNLRLVAPITDWKENFASYFWMTRLDPDERNGLAKTSAADGFQVRSVSLTRFIERTGQIPDEQTDRIVKSVALCMR